MKVWSRVVLGVVALAVIVSCAETETKPKPSTKEYLGLKYKNSWQSDKNAITFMTFNVENLFDLENDPKKNDETFLPFKLKQSKAHKASCAKLKNPHWRKQCFDWDWNEEVLKFKLDVVAKSILQAKSGAGPDILVLQEVENKSVLEQLNKKGLNYKTVVLIEGKDKRGIDVGLLSRLPLVGQPRLHAIQFTGFSRDRVQDTRGILQVDLKMPNEEVVTVLGVHFPAPFHPVEMRVQAYKALNNIKASLPQERLVLAAGDFNVPKREDQKTNIVETSTGKNWIVGHKVACEACPGSTYYPPQDSWSFMDMLMWSKFSQSKWMVLPGSMRVLRRGPGQMAESGAPARFEIEGPRGVSDHWPLAIDLKLTQ